MSELGPTMPARPGPLPLELPPSRGPGAPLRLLAPPPPQVAEFPVDAPLPEEAATVNLTSELPGVGPELAADLGLGWEPHPEPRPDQRDALRQVLPLRIAIRQQLLPLELRAPQSEGAAEGAGASNELAKAAIDADATLVIATARPFDLLSRQLAVGAVARPIEWVLAPDEALREALQRFYGVGADTFEQILEGREFDPSGLEDQDEASVLDSGDEEASVVKFVNQILRDGLDQRATDIHFEPLADSLRIRYRIDGVLQEATVPPNIRALQSSVIARLKIMARLDIAEKRLPQDGRIHLQSAGQDIDVRVATIPTVEGESVSLRLLNQERYTLDRLGLPAADRHTIEELLALPNGIILVTGPTGSGKSTSLYTFLSQLNTPGQRIVTIEDPVENKLPGVMQIAVRPEINLTFAAGLRSILRGDPNIVMIGEIRDLETAEIAIRASLTGHLVFSTLHTNDAVGGVHRLIDMGCEPFLVAASVRAFFAQRLVRKLCEKCAAAPRELDHGLLDSLGIPCEGRENIREPRGCPACRGTGYRGRLAIYEIVQVTRKLGDQIARNASYSELAATARAQGTRWLREYGWGKLLQGQTSLAEVISATAHTDEES